MNNYTITHPNLCVLIILIAFSLFTGSLEKSFSKLAKICYKDRNSVSLQNLENLLAVLKEPAINFTRATEILEKNRITVTVSCVFGTFLFMKLLFNFVLFYHGTTYEPHFVYIHGNTF